MSGYVNANKLSLVGAERTNILPSQQRSSKGTSGQSLQDGGFGVRLHDGFHLYPTQGHSFLILLLSDHCRLPGTTQTS